MTYGAAAIRLSMTSMTSIPGFEGPPHEKKMKGTQIFV